MANRKSVKSVARRVQKLNDEAAEHFKTKDSFQNFALNLGLGTDNAMSASTYGFNPITLIRTLLEWIHRGSWLGGVAIDLVADDMTRAGIEYRTTMPPDDVEAMVAAATRLGFWSSLNSGFKWGRLYGGCIVVMLLDGQDMATPLRLQTVDKGQLKGFLVLDRWAVEPSMENLITELGPNVGLPKFYTVVADAPGMSRMKIHYSRVMRCGGVELPYWQKVGNNMWDLSVLERLYDRMVAYDSATTGAAQLVYKSYLRTLKMDGLRQAVAAGGDALGAIVSSVNFMRRYQSNEGINLIDGLDEFTVDSNVPLTGIADALGQLGQQLSGALQIPLSRLFGQSPSGFDSGDSSERTYYDGINHQQEKHRESITTFLTVMAMSEQINLPEDFNFTFKSLWQLDDVQKADTAAKVTTAVGEAFDKGIISQQVAMKELRQSSSTTGVFSNISDEDIESAETEPPDPSEVLGNGEDDLSTGGEPDESAGTIPSEGASA